MNQADIISAFLDVLSAAGIKLDDPNDIKPDGDKHRAKVVGDKKTNLVYQIFPDERPAGWYDYYKEGKAATFSLCNDAEPLSEQQLAELQKRMKDERQRRQLETNRRYGERASYVQQLWSAAASPISHPYLTDKQITNTSGIRQLDTLSMTEFMDDPDNQGTCHNVLLIPVYNLSLSKPTIESMQIIDGRKTKLFAKGARMRGNCHPIRGANKDYVIICEGWATGIALNRITGQTVIVCMYAGNMAAVATVVREYFKDGRPIVFAPDNDWTLPAKGKPNAGLVGAADASDIVRGYTVAPEYPDNASPDHTDWDDWVRHYGTDADALEIFTSATQQAEALPAPAPAEFSDDRPLDNAPFRLLGHQGENYYYLDNEGLLVRRIPAASHTKSQLFVIADKFFWESRYPVRNKDGVIIGANWDMATNDLLRAQHHVGIYDHTRMRGRGAWYDCGRSVLHVGNTLIVDGDPVDIRDFKTTYIYEAGTRLDFTGGQAPLPRKQISAIIDLSRMLSWDMPVYADLCLGWCIASVICGALPWRPHIWLTGPAGSGKSWVYDNLMKWLVGEDWAMLAQSATTEAGIRQTMRRDARPVMFDEAEAEDKQARQRMQNVLELMRQASSETGAPIVKGSRDGDAVEYKTRSCFAFCSINVMAVLAADVSRISVLSLHKNTSPDAAERFDTIKRSRTELLTPIFCQQFRALAVSLIPKITANSEVMTRVASEIFGSRRDGDQVGTLAVCFWAMSTDSTNPLTLDSARAFLSQYEWPQGFTPTKEDMDEYKCLNTIMSAIIQTEISTFSGGSTTLRRSVAELAEIAAGYKVCDDENQALDAKSAEATLRRHGLGTHQSMLVVSNSHPGIRRILAETPWERKWENVLSRVPDAEHKDNFRFSGGVNGTRAIAVRLRQQVKLDSAF